MSQYFPNPFRSFGGNINVKVDLSNYATKADIKNSTHVDTSSFALKANLVSLKTEVDKLDIAKLVPVPVDLSKLSDVVTETSDFVLKTKYDTDKSELENKISDVTDFVKKVKLAELENTIPDVSNLATKIALATAENKIPVSSLVKKQTITLKLQKLKVNLIIIIMINMLLPQSLRI